MNFMKTKLMRAGLSLLPAIFLLLGNSLQARPLEIWISSFQDKVYYENMVKLYQKKAGTNFQANVHAYGFREMPDKLAVAIKTGQNPPDVVQLDEVLFGTYLAGEVPFVDLADRVKKAGWTRTFSRNGCRSSPITARPMASLNR